MDLKQLIWRILLLHILMQVFALSAQADEPGLQIPDIQVYSTKRTETNVDTPATIEVLDKKQLSARPVLNLYDIGHAVSDISIQQSGFYKSINIRGIGGGGRNAGFSTRVGVYLDGVYVGQTLALDNPLLNLEQIEVLKGPQGYLFGNNSNAGVINIISTQPSHHAEASLKAGIGNYGYQQQLLTLNDELSPSLTARLLVSNERRDGYVNNVFDGSDLKGLGSFATRALFKWEADEALNLTLSLDYMNKHQTQFLAQAQTGLFGQPLNTENNQFDKVNRNYTPRGITQSGGVHLNATYFLPENASLHSITAYRNNTNAIVHDNDYSAVDLLHTEYHDAISQYTQELRYESADNMPVRYIAGVFLSRELNSNNSKAILGTDTNTPVILPAIGFPLPFDVVFGVAANTVLPLRGKVTSDTAALFSSLDYQITDKLKFHAGWRISIERKQLDLFMDGRQSGNLNMAYINGAEKQMTNSFFSPMLGLSYHPNDHSQFYVTSAKSYKSGGWNVEMMTQQQANDGYAYAPESVINVEFGYKTRGTDSMMQLSLFRNQIKDYQVFQYTNLGGPTLMLQLRNAAKARTQGAEVTIQKMLDSHFGVQASLAYLDAKYLSFPGGLSTGEDAKGATLPDAPKLSGTFSASYGTYVESLGGQLTFVLQNYFQTATRSGLSNDDAINQLDGRVLQDAGLSYQAASQKWLWSVWVKNLLNKHYELARSSDAFGNVYAIYADPRLFGFSGQYNF